MGWSGTARDAGLARARLVGGIVGFGPIDRRRSGRCSLKAVANDAVRPAASLPVDRPWAMSSSRLPSPTMPPVASTLSVAGGKKRAASASYTGRSPAMLSSDVGVVHPTAVTSRSHSTVVPSLNVTCFTALRAGGRDALPDRASTTRAIEMPADCRLRWPSSGFVRREHHCSSSRLHAVHPDQPLDRTRCHHAGKIVALEHVRTLDRAGCTTRVRLALDEPLDHTDGALGDRDPVVLVAPGDRRVREDLDSPLRRRRRVRWLRPGRRRSPTADARRADVRARRASPTNRPPPGKRRSHARRPTAGTTTSGWA